MNDEALQSGRVQLGLRVRKLRKSLGKTLIELGRDSSLSASTLSKVENGALSVNYDTLVRLATALSVDLAELFSQSEGLDPAPGMTGRRSITRANQGEIYETGQYRYEILGSDISAKKFLPMLATLGRKENISKRDLIRHSGEEFIYVIEGEVEVYTDLYTPALLKAGDSLYFDSSMGHALTAVGKQPARIVWVATSGLAETRNGLRAGSSQARLQALAAPKPAKK